MVRNGSTASLAVVAITLAALGPIGCTPHAAEVAPWDSRGRALTRGEARAIQEVADRAIPDIRVYLPQLPPQLKISVRFGRDVIPETGESGTTVLPNEVVWSVDPDRDILATIRTQLRPTLFHELHHLVRSERGDAWNTIRDRVVSEGLATAFERDCGRVDPPWGKAPPEITRWTEEVLRLPDDAPPDQWLSRHPDGRRWVGMRVGTFLADRARQRSGRTAAELVRTPTDEVLRLAQVASSP